MLLLCFWRHDSPLTLQMNCLNFMFVLGFEVHPGYLCHSSNTKSNLGIWLWICSVGVFSQWGNKQNLWEGKRNACYLAMLWFGFCVKGVLVASCKVGLCVWNKDIRLGALLGTGTDASDDNLCTLPQRMYVLYKQQEMNNCSGHVPHARCLIIGYLHY